MTIAKTSLLHFHSQHHHLLLQTLWAPNARSHPSLSILSCHVVAAAADGASSFTRNRRWRRHRRQSQQQPPLPLPGLRCRSSTLLSRAAPMHSSRRSKSFTTTITSRDERGRDDVSKEDVSNVPNSHGSKNPLSASANRFQQLIASRRTVSNFMPSRPASNLSTDRQFLQEAISRGVQCAAAAPNHKITEPTTFHRILTPSLASTRLSDIAYQVTFQRLIQNKLSGEEACRSEAMRKREKWSAIPAFVAVTVSGMDDQTLSGTSTTAATCGGDPYRELPYVPPSTVRQLEDYASACASIQNLLLSLHSEGLGAKWATGPVINTHAFRELIQCGKNDMVAGLIMVGWPKQQLPRMRRKRGLEGDVLRDVDLCAGAGE